MKILVTGKHGQIVSSLLALSNDNYEIIPVGRPELDLTKPLSIYAAIASQAPNIIISAAAYTAVDQAETEPSLAYAVNAIGAGAVSKAAEKLNIPIIHISTDYIFGGTKSMAYTESDEPNPQSIYGASKLQGEQLVAMANPKHVILRTAWLYSPYGNNFLKTMLRLGKGRNEINIVSDQLGNPTSALNIASAILHICNAVTEENFQDWGIYNLVDDSQATWNKWAEYIFSYANLTIQVNPIRAADYPSKVKRPSNSRLST